MAKIHITKTNNSVCMLCTSCMQIFNANQTKTLEIYQVYIKSKRYYEKFTQNIVNCFKIYSNAIHKYTVK